MTATATTNGFSSAASASAGKAAQRVALDQFDSVFGSLIGKQLYTGTQCEIYRNRTDSRLLPPYPLNPPSPRLSRTSAGFLFPPTLPYRPLSLASPERNMLPTSCNKQSCPRTRSAAMSLTSRTSSSAPPPTSSKYP